MAVLSVMLANFGCKRNLQRLYPTLYNVEAVRSMAGGGHKRMMLIKPSRFQWNKFKDLINFYILLGVIPLGTLVFFVNIYVGPAELAEIPEGYTPHHWEYQKHPIKRWFAKYVYTSHQQEYEKFMHYLKEESDKQRLRMLENKVYTAMENEGDYQAWFYRPFTAKYVRRQRTITDSNYEHTGEDEIK